MSYTYLILLSFSLDLLSSVSALTRRSFCLSVRSNFKFPFYILKRFYSVNKMNTFLYLVTSIICMLGGQNLPQVLYSFLLPIIVYYTHPVFIFLPFIFPIPICVVFITFYKLLRFDLPFFDFKLPSIILLLPAFFIASISESSLILYSLIACAALDNLIYASHLDLKKHRNRYIISLLTRGKVTSLSFSTKIQSNLKNAFISLLILLIIYGGITHNMISLIIIALSSLVFYYFSFDKLFNYTYTQTSIVYNSRLGRWFMNYLPLFIVSCFFSYRLIAPYITINNLLVEFLYILFLLLIVVFLKKRTLVYCLLIGLLVGCSNPSIKGFEVFDNTPLFYGAMESRNTQIITLLPSSILKVENGAMVKKKDLLVIENSSEYVNELKRLEYQIYATKKSSILDKSSRNEKLKELEFEIKLLKDSAHHYSNVNGLISISNDTLNVLSSDLHLLLTLSEAEYPLIKDMKEFRVLNTDKQEIATTTLLRSIPNHSPDGLSYTLIFEDFKHQCYPFQSLIITPKDNVYIIPNQYVRKENDSFFVKNALEEVKVGILTQNQNMTFVNHGLDSGTVIFPYE